MYFFSVLFWNVLRCSNLQFEEGLNRDVSSIDIMLLIMFTFECEICLTMPWLLITGTDYEKNTDVFMY